MVKTICMTSSSYTLNLSILNYIFSSRVELDQSLKSSKERVAKAKATVKTETGK